MPPLRTMSSIKPTKTERSHEENQERAYIAASRRSDRSLEARVESARRASEIHKKRTGRSLRVTEQDVVNEEMYEEEDDDIPWMYRRAGAHLPGGENSFLGRRVQAMLAIQMEQQRMMSAALANQWPNNPEPTDTAQFMNPQMMQMPYSGYPNQMLPPQMSNRTNSSYRQTPYPIQTQQNNAMRQAPLHQRAASHDLSGVQQQYPQSAQTTPVEPRKFDERRMSLPVHPMAQIPQYQQTPQQAMSSNQTTPVLSQQGSTVTTPTAYQAQTPSPKQPQPQQYQRPASFIGSYDNSSFQDASNSLGPLTTSLPMHTQQMLSNATWPVVNEYPFNLTMPTHAGSKPQQQPFYSYKPNGKSVDGNMNKQPTTSTGLDQTLLAPTVETNTYNKHEGAMVDTPVMSFNPTTGLDGNYGMTFVNNEFDNLDFDFFDNDLGSGQITPANGNDNNQMFNEFVHQTDMTSVDQANDVEPVK